ncbi:MAG: gamma-glutamylcyclotransferase [Subdoligranulum variabile]|nr:gamma-glutamylcyclotransferase [Subdoligranulum variabile]
MSRKEYFAYGSNLNFEQMTYRCPEATAVGTAKLEGYELAFRRGYLTILPKEGASVEGLIWSVTDHDESQLDCYEGYPTFYDKETLTVTDADGTILAQPTRTVPGQPAPCTQSSMNGWRLLFCSPYSIRYIWLFPTRKSSRRSIPLQSKKASLTDWTI